jgi:hypothetical protein
MLGYLDFSGWFDVFSMRGENFIHCRTTQDSHGWLDTLSLSGQFRQLTWN